MNSHSHAQERGKHIGGGGVNRPQTEWRCRLPNGSVTHGNLLSSAQENVTIDPHRPAATQGRITAEYVAALALAESATLAEAATGVLRAMCEALGWDYGALWNTDAGSGFLHCVNTWHLPTVNVPEFEAVDAPHDLHTRRRSPGPCLGQRRPGLGP